MHFLNDNECFLNLSYLSLIDVVFVLLLKRYLAIKVEGRDTNIIILFMLLCPNTLCPVNVTCMYIVNFSLKR